MIDIFQLWQSSFWVWCLNARTVHTHQTVTHSVPQQTLDMKTRWYFCTRPTHMSGQHICNSSWKGPKSSVKDRFYCTCSAWRIRSTDTTTSVSSGAHVSCCWSPENCWTCSVTRSCTKPFRDSFLLRAEWWRCFVVWPRTTRWRSTSRTGRGGEKSPPRTRLMSTSRPFWRLSLMVCKVYYTCTFTLIALKEQVTFKKKNVNIHSHQKPFLSFVRVVLVLCTAKAAGWFSITEGDRCHQQYIMCLPATWKPVPQPLLLTPIAQ